MEYFEDSNPPANAEIGCKVPFLDGHYLYPVALQRRQRLLHGFIQLVQQVAQVEMIAASLAAPPDLTSGTMHGQRPAASRANEYGRLLFHVQSPLSLFRASLSY
jgi:hypothetical protein